MGRRQLFSGIFVLDHDSEAGGVAKRDALSRSGVVDKDVAVFADELQMINKFAQLVKVVRARQST
jgi:hypothetical protein